MNEIEIYLKASNEEEINRIIEKYALDINSDNLEFKKTKIRTLLKNPMTDKKKKRRYPFSLDIIISEHKKEYLWNLTKKELLMLIFAKASESIRHIYIANYFLLYPNEFDDLGSIVEDNIAKGNGWFDCIINLDDEDEIKQYIEKVSLLSDTDRMIGLLDIAIRKAKNDGVLSLEGDLYEKMKDMNLAALINHLNNCSDEKQSTIFKYIYIKTHPELEKYLVQTLATEIVYKLPTYYTMTDIERNLDSDNKLKFEQAEIQLKELREEIKKLEKEKKDNDKKHKSDVQALDMKLSECFASIREMQTENRKKIDELESSNKIQKAKITEVEGRMKLAEKKLSYHSSYMNYSFPKVTDDYIFGIICSMDVNITKDIFKEIKFIPVDNWQNELKNHECPKKIYVQREGIPTKQMSSISDYCKQKGFTLNIILASNEKMLIEKITLIKNEMER